MVTIPEDLIDRVQRTVRECLMEFRNQPLSHETVRRMKRKVEDAIAPMIDDPDIPVPTLRVVMQKCASCGGTGGFELVQFPGRMVWDYCKQCTGNGMVLSNDDDLDLCVDWGPPPDWADGRCPECQEDG